MKKNTKYHNTQVQILWFALGVGPEGERKCLPAVVLWEYCGCIWARSDRAGQGKVRFYHRHSAAHCFPVHRPLCWGRRTICLKMTSMDPLKSVISIIDVDDTSLALPSVNQYRSGQQRVLDQVQTMRRAKSRQTSSRSGSTSLSPTSKSRQAYRPGGFYNHKIKKLLLGNSNMFASYLVFLLQNSL